MLCYSSYERFVRVECSKLIGSESVIDEDDIIAAIEIRDLVKDENEWLKMVHGKQLVLAEILQAETVRAAP